ncbi:MAG TPA: archease [Solirubrobacteraceae bacterium]|nr:archease [Solirubrobacteraceae bacterium]
MADDGYRWVEHTAELELEVHGRTEEAVFAQALRAFAELVGDRTAREAVTREIALAGAERAVLLAHWLDELEFLAETEDLVPDAIERLELVPAGLRATVRCHRGHPRSVVKGVTYHRLAFERDGDGYRATVILDV